LAGPGGRALRCAAVTVARTAGRHSDAALHSLLCESIALLRRSAGLEQDHPPGIDVAGQAALPEPAGAVLAAAS
jgi:hypothetical protein